MTPKVLIYVLLLVLVQLISCERQDESTESKFTGTSSNVDQDGASHADRKSQPQESLNGKQLLEDDLTSVPSENDISNQNIRTPFKSQQEYACGRAVGNSKYRDLLQKDHSYSPTIRSKYRPLEIRMPRIIGGDETAPGEFPWAVSVKLNGQPICGGSLINRNWILTAAHCVVGYNPKNLTVRLGAYRIKDTSETQTVDLPVAMFIVHKEYSMPRPFSNDIALLKMEGPLEYTDFIIPICLPTEDQVTTSTSSVVIDDYSNRLNLNERDGDETGGIVISTKMSDGDIAKCFTKLEQNYLNSIGLGQGQSHQSAPPSPVSTASSKPSHATSYDSSVMDSIFTEIDNLLPSSSSHKVNGNLQNEKHSDENLEQPIFTNSNHSPVNKNHRVSSTSNNYHNYAYFGPPWGGRSHGSDIISITDESPLLKSSGAFSGYGQSSRREMIKLSRLPISKELLHEIQSVGSTAMTELSSALHQNDLTAIANDLNQVNRYVRVPAAANEPTILHSNNHNAIDNGYTVSKLAHGPTRNLMKTPLDTDDNDDPTKYSGLSGIVVGWGWVRELDGEDQANTKGYPSVTLQKVKLPILRNHVCESWFQSQAKKITLLPSQFCAGFNSGGKDACRGDSGGPMIIEDNSDTGRYKLVGIVSAGIGCARPSLPGLYTRVASFLPWINAQLRRY